MRVKRLREGRAMTEKRAGTVPFPKILCGICFGLCFFAFMLTETVINER